MVLELFLNRIGKHMLKLVETLSASSTQSDSNKIRLVDPDSQSVEVEGKTLEAQFVNSTGELLLVLTDDCPFEETLRLVLLSPDLALVDLLEFTSPYGSLIVQQVSPLLQNQLEIQGNNQQCFNAELLPEPLSISAHLAAKYAGRIVSKNKRMTLTP
jgi:hypothetical protein